jgi:hypothetical protein
MPILPDPRCFAATTTNPLASLSAQAVGAADATQRRQLLEHLQRELREALTAGRDDLLTDAVAEVVSPAAGRALWEALDRTINTPADRQSALAAQVFAIPLVLVTGGLAQAEVSATLRNASAVMRVLEAEGALGPARNFGLNTVLCADVSLKAAFPSILYRLLRGLESGETGTWADLIPADIYLDSAEESVHLRFLTGVIVTPAQAPSFQEMAADIGRWGMPISRELSAQLGQPGLSLLALPRPPAGPLQAAHAGRRAREEVAFQVFISRALRRLRSQAGDSEVEVAALETDGIGVRLASPFQPGRTETHRWELDALDDLADVTASILGLLEECRVASVRVLDTVVADADRWRGNAPAPRL